jgi:hypothetical protein
MCSLRRDGTVFCVEDAQRSDSGGRFRDKWVLLDERGWRSAFAFATCDGCSPACMWMALAHIAPNLFRQGELYNDDCQAWYLDQLLRRRAIRGPTGIVNHAEPSVCGRRPFNRRECRAMLPL